MIVRKHAGPETKGSNPTAGLTLLWISNPFRGNFNHSLTTGKSHGMPRSRLPKVMKYYSPSGRRNHGRPLKRLLDT